MHKSDRPRSKELISTVFSIFLMFNAFKTGKLLEREPRTVIHVKRAKMFDPMG